MNILYLTIGLIVFIYVTGKLAEWSERKLEEEILQIAKEQYEMYLEIQELKAKRIKKIGYKP